ncbi:DUF4255 domain-containing protein [Pseudomonas syringae]|uniref:DUF4255 domain-containing protein n=2 Tax=Pseudomonas syringae group TaxID=136849 RepID=A0A9Q4FKG2_PSESX|nr:DUF4255 domain-containing protein [Pseudomonas syringae]KTB65392.1 hypothetical protein AO067_23390 [Pseudomonas viridiflava ICMP 13104]MCF5467842.1 DUF4255 domain-containing protein [Pseudomonas syringae]MCF5472367.1 DUF4255 domain-containing protein [Pseudomonas syringae]MCF5481655.1 DUF4255 domain-containing protein [Pseudomonas syringae]MCF5488102.1 DUF4255 domain-containing protein [Pseudomonas syringae]
MIHVALMYIQQVLDQSLGVRLGLDSGCVILDGLSSTESSSGDRNRNKIVLTLVGLEHESNQQYYGGQRREGQHVHQFNPPAYFNLGVLISANFDDYAEALKQLTMVIAFFQANPSLDRINQPAMPEGLTTLTFEIENSPSDKMHNLWTALAVNYLPSILYKVRHVAVQAEQVVASSTVVKNITNSVAQ